jgi:hypothetical protein
MSCRPRRRVAVALLVTVIAGPAMAQDNPDSASDFTYRIVPLDRPLLHGWRATLDYGESAGPLDDLSTLRVGYSRTHEVKAGLEARIGQVGFGRLEAGFARRDSKRTLQFDNLDGDAEEGLVGATGGAFVLPFLAFGASFQYRFGSGEDSFLNRAGGFLTQIERDDRTTRVAPFFLATAPLGPVQLSLAGAYVWLRTHTDYTGAPIDSDNGRVNARVLSLEAGWWATDRWKFGGGVSWTDIPAQRVQADALPLDSAWGHVSANVTYRLTDQLDASLRAGHDLANARGDGFRLGAGLGYRF